MNTYKIKFSIGFFCKICSVIRPHSKHAGSDVTEAALICGYLLSYLNKLQNFRISNEAPIFKLDLQIFCSIYFENANLQTALSRVKSALKILNADKVLKIISQDTKTAVIKFHNELYNFYNNQKNFMFIPISYLTNANYICSAEKKNIREKDIRPKDQLFTLLLILAARDKLVTKQEKDFYISDDIHNLINCFVYEGKLSAKKVISRLKSRAEHIFKTVFRDRCGALRLSCAIVEQVKCFCAKSAEAYKKATAQKQFIKHLNDNKKAKEEKKAQQSFSYYNSSPGW